MQRPASACIDAPRLQPRWQRGQTGTAAQVDAIGMQSGWQGDKGSPVFQVLVTLDAHSCRRSTTANQLMRLLRGK